MDKHAEGENEADPKDGYLIFEKAIPHIYVYVRVEKRTWKWIITISLFAMFGPFLAYVAWKATLQGLHPLNILGGVAFFTFVLVYRLYTKVWRV